MKKGKVITLLTASLCCLFFCLPSVSFASSENWVEVIKISRNNGACFNTGLFSIDYPEWRIRWEFDPGEHWHFADLHFLNITVYPEREFVTYIDQIYGSGNLNSGINYLYSNPGQFHIRISTGFIESFTIIIEQNTNSTPQSEANWVEVARFDGVILTDSTEIFTIDNVEWRIKWKVTPTPIDSTVVPLRVQFNVVEVGKKVAKIYYPPSLQQIAGTVHMNQTGNFRIDFNLIYVENYSVIIEQNIDSIPEFPSWIILLLFLSVSLTIAVYKKRLIEIL